MGVFLRDELKLGLVDTKQLAGVLLHRFDCTYKISGKAISRSNDINGEYIEDIC